MAIAYLLVGKELYLKREFIQNLRKSFFQDTSSAKLNSQEFRAKKEPLVQALDFLKSIPFLAEKRLVVLWDIDKLAADEKERLLAFLENSKSSQNEALILVSEETSAKKNAFLDKLSARAKLVACHPPFERNLPSWIETRVKKESKTLDRAAVAFLIEQAGSDLSALDSAIEELSIYVHPKTIITRQDAERLLGKSAESDVFLIVDFVLKKDAGSALKVTTELLKSGGRAFEIVSVLAGQFERLKKAAELLSQGLRDEEVARSLGVHSFFSDKFLAQAKLWGREPVGRLTEVLKCDQAIKTGALNERIALEQLILRIC